MSVRSKVSGLAVAVLCLAGPALAQVEAEEVQERIGFDPAATKVGVDMRVGVGGLTGDLGELTAPGPLLGITAGAQPSEAFGIEMGYEGQRLPIDDFRVGDEQAMYRHNLSLLAKSGPLLMEDKLRPYVGAGVGVSYLDVTDGAEDSGFYSNDMVRELPLAAGLDYRFNDNIHAGARASYRFLFGEEFADDARGGRGEGNLLNVGLTLGGRF